MSKMRMRVMIIAAALVIGCTSTPEPAAEHGEPDPPAATAPAATAPATAPATATPATATPAAATPAAAPTAAAPTAAAPTATPPGPQGRLRRIVNTEGDGVALRDECTDDSRSPDTAGQGFKEGAEVSGIQEGTGECAGWALVTGHDGRQGWVRLRYLDHDEIPTWPHDVSTDTWDRLIERLNAQQQDCVTSSLTADELRLAEINTILSRRNFDWEGRIFACMSREDAIALATAIGVAQYRSQNTDPAELTSCSMPFHAESAAIDQSTIITGDIVEGEPTDEYIAFATDFVVICLAIPRLPFVWQDAGLSDSTYPDEASCMEGRLRDDVTTTELLLDCAPSLLIARLATAESGWLSRDEEIACIKPHLPTGALTSEGLEGERWPATQDLVRSALVACAEQLRHTATAVHEGTALTLVLDDGSTLLVPGNAASRGTTIAFAKMPAWDIPEAPYYATEWHGAWEVSVSSPLIAPVTIRVPAADQDQAWIFARHDEEEAHDDETWLGIAMDVADGLVSAELQSGGTLAIWLVD